jgi:hypothetical protein
MQTRISNRKAAGAVVGAFSLIELLTAVSIMVTIIFALYAMFNRTQQALRANMTQVDVLEAGRATAEMVGRDLEQLSACNLPFVTNLYTRLSLVPSAPMVQVDTAQSPLTPPLRTNVLQELFLLSRETNNWVGTGYLVGGPESVYGVGTLYRYTVSTNYRRLDTNFISQFTTASLTNPVTGLLSTNFSRLADGVVHFRLTAYDPDGRRMSWDSTNTYPSYHLLRLTRGGQPTGPFSSNSVSKASDANLILQPDPRDPTGLQTRLSFVSTAVPAYLELELGVLENATYKQFQSLEDSPPQVAQAFLRKQAGKVQLFRQRIPIRTVQQ